VHISWFWSENFDNLQKQLKHQCLKTFLELSGPIYHDLVKVFFTSLQFNNDVLKSGVKGVEMEISKKVWKDVVG